MRIAVMGSGGVGGYYGGLLAKSGHEVFFIARGDHLSAILEHGLQVRSVHGDFNIDPVQATDKPAEIGTVDLVLVCVKTPDTNVAAQAIKPMLRSGTTVLPLENGIEAADEIGAVVGKQYVVGGVTWISSAIEAPGVIRQVSQFRRIVLGELDGSMTSRVHGLAEVLGDAGVDVEATAEIRKVLWSKLVFIAAISGIGSITRLAVGKYRHIPETRALLVGLMEEVETVGRAHEVDLDQTVVEKSMAFVDGAVPEIKASMQRDIEAGRRSELESMIGVICRKGRDVGVQTPIADYLYASLLPVEIQAGEIG